MDFYKSFNSLQTGKAFRTPPSSVVFFGRTLGFNSLQTGKAFRTVGEWLLGRSYRLPVSIPFKRERLSEQVAPGPGTVCVSGFQFPSNGKGFPNLRLL